MRGVIRVIAVWLVAAASAPLAEACSCIGSGPPCQNFFQSEAVFVGTVTGIRPLQVQADADRHVFDRRVVAFTVEKRVRGTLGATVDVRTGNGGGDCGFDFKIGERYVVYAYRHTDGSLGTGICSRTRRAAEAAEDLAYFAALPATGSGARLFGTVKHWETDYAAQKTVQYGGVADAQVLVRGARGTYSAMTDAAGNYSITGIVPGSYEMELLPPAEFGAAGRVRIEFTDPRACREQAWSVHYDGRIRGMVVDGSGRPAAGVRLELVPASTPRSPVFMPRLVSDDAGRFEATGVPPGRYVLAVGYTPRYDDEVAFPATFYPASATVEGAQSIAVGPAEQVELEPFRLPSALPRRTLTGIVVTPDGVPVGGATVSLRGPRGSQASPVVTTNERGEFSVRAFEGQTYTVHSYYNPPGDPRSRQLQASEILRISGTPQPVRLVLTPIR